jgi:hypothetical protein
MIVMIRGILGTTRQCHLTAEHFNRPPTAATICQATRSESLRRTSDSGSPTISTVFRGDELPEMILTLPPGKPSALLKRDSTAALALPRSAGAVTRTLNASPSQPAMPLREDPGTTLIRSLKLVALISSCDEAGDWYKDTYHKRQQLETQEDESIRAAQAHHRSWHRL